MLNLNNLPKNSPELKQLLKNTPGANILNNLYLSLYILKII